MTGRGNLFREGFVEADGFRIRYMEAGQGIPLVHLHGAGGLRLTRAHDLLSHHFRVVAFEMPGFGQSSENSRTRTMPELASTMARAVESLGLGTFNLMGTSFGGKTALWLALQVPERVLALVLEAPAAIHQAGAELPSGSPEEMARRLYAHPERLGAIPLPDPATRGEDAVAGTEAAGTVSGRGPRAPAAGARHADTRAVRYPGPSHRAGDGTHLQGDGAWLPPRVRLRRRHAISTDRPEAFTEVVVDFLERHEAFVISRTETVIHP